MNQKRGQQTRQTKTQTRQTGRPQCGQLLSLANFAKHPAGCWMWQPSTWARQVSATRVWILVEPRSLRPRWPPGRTGQGVKSIDPLTDPIGSDRDRAKSTWVISTAEYRGKPYWGNRQVLDSWGVIPKPLFDKLPPRCLADLGEAITRKNTLWVAEGLYRLIRIYRTMKVSRLSRVGDT